jgi:hypothetical protein
MSLEFVRKVPVFGKPKRGGYLPWPPLVGERSVVVADDDNMTLLDRQTLSVVSRHKMPLYRPVCWTGPDHLVLTGDDVAGVWDQTRQDFVWRRENVSGGYHWRDELVVWASESSLDVLHLATGELERSIDVGADAGGYSTFCCDYLVSKTPDVGDPIRAVGLAEGRIVWKRDVLAAMAEQRPDSQPEQRPAIGRASMSDRCVVTRDGITAACSLADGAVLWTADVFVPYYFPLAERGLIPVLSAPRFTVIDEASGAILCDRQHPTLKFMYREKSGSLLGNLAVFASESGHVAAFHLQTGDLVYTKHHERVGFWGTAVADGRLLAVATDGNLWIYEAA